MKEYLQCESAMFDSWYHICFDICRW